ncbi:MAG TPA: ABC transporter substrate-binding protein, partial [Chloroflexota bacterium]|nr:ABC transporter substrate-binding protein [Chloroflexota bacterium]
EGARKEGRLSLVWGENSAGGSKAAERWRQGLNQTYGLNIEVTFTPGPSMPEMGVKLAQEYQANRPATSDVMLGAQPQFAALLEAGVLQAVDWPSWAANVRDPKLLGAPDGTSVHFATLINGITYHTGKIGTAPKSLADLLDGSYQGRLASTPYAAGFTDLASPELWGEQRTVDYVTRLSQQIGGLMRCGETERITSGEFDLLAIDCGNYEAAKAQAQGAPIGHVVPADAATLGYWYLGVPKNAQHPNAAKLFVNYALGREAQQILYQTSFADLHLLPGSHLGAEVDAVRGQGVAFHETDIAFVMRQDPAASARVLQKLQAILQRK